MFVVLRKNGVLAMILSRFKMNGHNFREVDMNKRTISNKICIIHFNNKIDVINDVNGEIVNEKVVHVDHG
ncbi:hypothetical protein [Bacillus chungangensis]|uniref:Uncharacterized protein n=1 Tax=Bacillus chungangensis TaxID=587633 RepID=A0ABT9WT67_9BACI|nr:hypothetical protein [Bacillus chungangensis]MDQ0176420.1 hypothetical protein [Bacillus chungangensis]